SVVVANAGSPNALPVNFATVQMESGTEIDPIDAITGQLPVHQILRVHHEHSRVHVHGGAGQIVVVTDANYVGIFEFLVKQRVGIRSVAVVGGPRVSGSGRRGHGVGRCGEKYAGLSDQAGERRAELNQSHLKTPRWNNWQAD